MKDNLYKIAIVILLLLNVAQFLFNNYAHRLPIDAIPDEETAMVVGKAVLEAVCGKDMILNQGPFNARYDERKKYWVVSGTWPDDPNLVGGLSYIFLRKSDGKILEIVHTM